MNSKKYISIIVGLATVGSLALALSVSAATMPPANGQHRPGMRQGQMPAVVGTVSAVSGNSITVNGKQGFNSTATVSFTVDATNAKVMKDNAASTVSNIAVGDMVAVQGSVSGTNVVATTIRDGVMMGGMGGKMGTGVFGTVASVSGTTLTVTGNAGPNGTATTAYTVDASSATVMKDGATSSVAGIAVGDKVMVQGTVSGTSVTAKTIRDGLGQGQMMQGNGEPVIAGKITAISGNEITITNSSNVTYTVDATTAKIMVDNQASTISGIAVGDSVIVQGTVNGNSVVAASLMDNKAMAGGSATAPKQQPVGMGGFMGSVTNFFKHMFGF